MVNCQDCKHKRLREESALAMAERTIRRLWVTVLVLIFLMVGMSVSFFVYETQFEEIESYEETEIEATQMGSYNFVSGGDLTYGTENQN